MSGGIASSSGQGTASPGLTIALVGIAITASLGTVEASNADIVALTGEAITTSQGSLTAIRGKPLVTISQGTAVVSATVPLVGSAITSAQGTTTPNADDTVALTGQGIASGQGTVEAYKSEALAGIEIVSSALAGNIVPNIRPTDIEGQQINSASGSVSASSDDVTVNLSGHEATFELGSVVVGGQTLVGVVSTPAAGTATPSSDVALTGVGSTCVQGSVTAAQEAAEDTYISSSLGVITSTRSVALLGVESISAQGTIGITGDVSTALTGEEATTEQGSVLADFGPTLSGQVLTGTQYFVGAPGTAALTGAEVVAVTGTIHIDNDRTYPLVGTQIASAQGVASPRIAPVLVGIAQGTGIGSFAAQPDRKALVGQVITAGQGILRLPEVGGRRKGGVGWGNWHRRKTLQEKLEERLLDAIEEFAVDQPARAPTISVANEIREQVVQAVIRDQEQRSTDLPSDDEEEEIIEAAVHAMMMLIKRKRT